MTRQFLEECLERKLTLQEIGDLAGRSKSTVSYHLKKHGLSPTNAGTHSNKGGLSRAVLEPMHRNGMSLSEIAAAVDRNPGTVRHWLIKFDLWPTESGIRRQAAKRAREQGARRAIMECRHHGRTEFIFENRGSYRCLACRSERVSAWRRRLKRKLISEAGGACVLCGYDRYPGALQFHHLDPATKRFMISREGATRSYAEAKAEASKCVLLCATCHAEVEGGHASLPARTAIQT